MPHDGTFGAAVPRAGAPVAPWGGAEGTGQENTAFDADFNLCVSDGSTFEPVS